MTNRNKGKADKGSRFCLQEYIYHECEQLTLLITTASPSLLSFNYENIIWQSPLPDKEYYEYRDDFLEPLGMANKKELLRTFWPKNGPQWDGLAIIKRKSKNGILLIEAKAHPKETKSDIKATSKKSISLIEGSLERTKGFMGVKFSNWGKNNYQLSNRLAYSYFLNEILEIPTWLVLINFVNDESHIETELSDCKCHYESIFHEMGIKHDSKLLDKIIIIFPQALNIKNNETS